MLLLLLLGAGTAMPSTDGVRAYGQTTYRAVSESATAQSSVTLAGSSEGAVTNASSTEE